MKTNYGYMRVSTKEQNEDRQRIRLLEAGVNANFLFLDKQSGKDFNRSQYQTLLGMLDSDSVLFVTSIDRLGRNYTEIIKQWKLITQEKKSGHRGARHAASGHAKTKGFAGYIDKRPRSFPLELCGRNGAVVYS
ncbi:MAG: recombinase family protein [Treponema sp.]|nr:recombinase family protein [Treponema sp.]